MTHNYQPCACLGPQYGEPYCHCTMERLQIERSAEWHIEHSPEAIAKKNAELQHALSEMFANSIAKKQ